ncbi:MAG: FlgD immunoglobulin-like domain containing protein [Hyphomicrobiales bacterium]
MRRAYAVLVGSLLSSLVAAAALAATSPLVIKELYGTGQGDELGTSVAIVGDVNGDGYADYLIGVPGATVDGFVAAGYVTLRSGKDGSEIRRLEGGSVAENRGYVAALGDVDGDGVPDYAISSPTLPIGDWTDAGDIVVISGATGAYLYLIDGNENGALYGERVCGIGDVDLDGKSDIAVGVPHHQVGVGIAIDAGAVMIYSGADGSLIRRIEGTQSYGEFGFSVSPIGDVDGDGRADLIVGEPGDGATIHGAAHVISAWTGTQIYGFQSASTTDRFGFAVASLGDVDGDGVADIAVSAPTASYATLTENGAVPVFSGATKSPIFTIHGATNGRHLGAVVRAAGDVDADGRGDIVVDANVYSGGAEEILFQADPNGGETLGEAVAGGGDVNGDGGDDVIIAAPGYDIPASNGNPPIYDVGYAVVMGYPLSDIPVVIDAMPAACPNRLPAPATGSLDVALLGRADLDADSIDVSTVRLNGVAPLSTSVEPDVAVTRASPACDDCGPPTLDGIPDLLAQFDAASIAATLHPNGNGLAPLDVTGRLRSGRRIAGRDCIHVPVAHVVVSPNPARRGAGTVLSFTLPAGGPTPHVRVYDVKGRLVRDVALRYAPAGPCSIAWDGKDARGEPVAGGLYVARVEAGDRDLGTSRIMIVP